MDGYKIPKGRTSTDILHLFGRNHDRHVCESKLVAPPASEGHDVRGEEAGKAAASVPDLEGLPVLLVGGGAAGVVLVVQQAGDVGEVALLARHPQVARPRVKNYLHPRQENSLLKKSSSLKVHEHEILSRCSRTGTDTYF
jgi:hypothetical protein